ncbi:hypothetical protein WN51_04285 [Melipona quadrifasciata]|uniref:Uncharacterized protein n=1 Tax=Melipona quadrifasciata TaxID=166423 RepID=A0A0M8ZTK2_9HYME|nr:hypothetical protein WN51_04285 [Melipona quadrifasciata]
MREKTKIRNLEAYILTANFRRTNSQIYVVADEPLLRGSSTNRDFSGRRNNDFNGISKASDDFEFKSEFTEDSLSWMLTDVEILQCALSVLRECDDDPAAAFRYLFVGTPPLYGRELKDTDRQMKILIKAVRSSPGCQENYVPLSIRNKEVMWASMWVLSASKTALQRNGDTIVSRDEIFKNSFREQWTEMDSTEETVLVERLKPAFITKTDATLMRQTRMQDSKLIQIEKELQFAPNINSKQ